MSRPTVLCPVDFSDASRGALRYAAAIAEHFHAELLALTINEPLLEEVSVIRMGEGWLSRHSAAELGRFTAHALEHRQTPEAVQFEVRVGKPAEEILRLSQEPDCRLIVMSSRGLTGIRKLFFGATTERVLRETHVPVLVTPPDHSGPATEADLAHTVRRVLAPVDLAATGQQVSVAERIAKALDVPLILAHVVEPLRYPASVQASLPSVEAQRRGRADKALSDLVGARAAGLRCEGLTAFGDPAEEIAKIARDRDAGLIVIGLHASAVHGPRMGSVTYRVLCLTHGLVLAWPPECGAHQHAA